MRSEQEDVLRWNDRTRPALQRAKTEIEKAMTDLPRMRAAVLKDEMEKARDLQMQILTRVYKALGVCIDPDVPGKKAKDLAMRCFFSDSVGHKPLARYSNIVRASGQSDLQNEGHERKQILNDYTETLLSLQGSSIPSEDIVRAISRKNWDAERFGEVWTHYLEELFFGTPCRECKRTGGSLNQKREGLRMFTEFKRSLEPKAVIEIEGDLATMDDDQLRSMQEQLVDVVIDRHPDLLPEATDS